MQLHEQYRPRDWSEVVGQDVAVGRIEVLRRRGLGGRAYWISGRSGVGKTTIAKLIAREVAVDWCTMEIDATALTPSTLRESIRTLRMMGMGEKSGRARLVNEAHGLRQDTIRQLLIFLEELPDHVVVCFTTTDAGEDRLFDMQIDAGPLLSRCVDLTLKVDLDAMAGRLQMIAVAEGLDGGAPIAAYRDLLDRHEANMRHALQAIEHGAMSEAAALAA